MKPTLKELINAFPAADRATKATFAAFEAARKQRQEIEQALCHLAKPVDYVHYRAADGSVVIVGVRNFQGMKITSAYIADVATP